MNFCACVVKLKDDTATPTFLHHTAKRKLKMTTKFMTLYTRQAELKKELFSACRAGDVERVHRAIAAGVDPKKAINKDSFSKETPLHTACEYVIIPSETSMNEVPTQVLVASGTIHYLSWLRLRGFPNF